MLMQIVGWYCFGMAVAQFVALMFVSVKEEDASKKLRRTLIWVSNPLFLIAAILALRAT